MDFLLNFLVPRITKHEFENKCEIVFFYYLIESKIID